MPKPRKINKIAQRNALKISRKPKPRINWLNILYVLVAVAVVVSLMAGVFSGLSGTPAPASTVSQVSQDTNPAGRDTTDRVPITVIPAQPTPAATATTP